MVSIYWWITFVVQYYLSRVDFWAGGAHLLPGKFSSWSQFCYADQDSSIGIHLYWADATMGLQKMQGAYTLIL
jgi:hypothetical protein